MTDVTKEFIDLCKKIIDASLYWTGEDEDKNPGLKTIRTLAGNYLQQWSQKCIRDLMDKKC